MTTRNARPVRAETVRAIAECIGAKLAFTYNWCLYADNEERRTARLALEEWKGYGSPGAQKRLEGLVLKPYLLTGKNYTTDSSQ